MAIPVQPTQSEPSLDGSALEIFRLADQIEVSNEGRTITLKGNTEAASDNNDDGGFRMCLFQEVPPVGALVWSVTFTTCENTRWGLTGNRWDLKSFPSRAQRVGPSIVFWPNGSVECVDANGKHAVVKLNGGATIEVGDTLVFTLDLALSRLLVERKQTKVFELATFDSKPLSDYSWHPFVGLSTKMMLGFFNKDASATVLLVSAPELPPSALAMGRLFDRVVDGDLVSQPVLRGFTRALKKIGDASEEGEEKAAVMSCCSALERMGDAAAGNPCSRVAWRACLPLPGSDRAELAAEQVLTSVVEAMIAEDMFMSGLVDEMVLEMEEATQFTRTMAEFYRCVLAEAGATTVPVGRVNKAANELRELAKTTPNTEDRVALAKLAQMLQLMCEKKPAFSRAEWAACVPAADSPAELKAVSLSNDEGAPVKLGTSKFGANDTNDGSSRFYCGRHLGKAAVPGSDGQCGPNNGGQCSSCIRFQRALKNDEDAPVATSKQSGNMLIFYCGRRLGLEQEG